MSGLYEELGIPKDAPQEQIRKAYKKRALQTHPDRLPPTATPADKAAAEEQFRKVNNAYEILSDPKKRSEYDVHGVWPPPEVEDFFDQMPGGSYRPFPRGQPSRGQTYPDPFFSHRHSPFSTFQFTDPFTLFESIFEGTPFATRSHGSFYSHRTDPFERFDRMHADIETFMDDIDRDPFGFGGFGGFSRFGFPMMPSFPALEPSRVDRGHWVSESYMTSTVNGVTQTIRKRVDSEGNEHITRTLPDGRKIRTINGVEQTSSGYLPYEETSQPHHRLTREPSAHRYLPPDTAHPQPVQSASRMDYSQPVQNTSRMDYAPTQAPPPPPYTPRASEYRDAPRKYSSFGGLLRWINSLYRRLVHSDSRHRRRRSTEKCTHLCP
ncbi:hypothetical protein CVT26_008065 [Gymnopilus dilepis]|uniref:J domain-containing protein n=1 Tax=Gymnopilus dilepis TaxID=231916 RepID=A0A409YJL9_9AGAR|nr:hypothetical protein CVT26_008065 [Gymnopilus dilepis]